MVWASTIGAVPSPDIWCPLNAGCISPFHFHTPHETPKIAALFDKIKILSTYHVCQFFSGFRLPAPLKMLILLKISVWHLLHTHENILLPKTTSCSVLRCQTGFMCTWKTWYKHSLHNELIRVKKISSNRILVYIT